MINKKYLLVALIIGFAASLSALPSAKGLLNSAEEAKENASEKAKEAQEEAAKKADEAQADAEDVVEVEETED